MNKYTDIAVDGYERVVRCENSKVGFTAWAAIHDSTLGPALGGCRVWNYESEDAALTDVLRLSKGMTYKNALARLPLGGGKSVIKANLEKVDRENLFDAFGDFVEYLDGTYITAEDVNSTLADMEIIQKKTLHVATVGASGNPSPFTAFGVYCAIKAAARFKLKRDDLEGLTVAVQGLGQTGGRLAELLAQDRCRIIGTDISKRNIRMLKEKISFERVDADEIYDVRCDIFSPCALGGIVNSSTIPRLRSSIIAGSANNQLLTEEDGEALRKRGILYVPDYAANAGGVINISCEIGQQYDSRRAKRKTADIAACVTEIFELAEKRGLPTNVVADTLAEQIISLRRMENEPMLNSA